MSGRPTSGAISSHLLRIVLAAAFACQLAAALSGMLMDQDQPPARPPARLVALDRRTGKALPLLPGLLDDSLLATGSFSFGAKLVHFDKLRVLGNVYASKINGRPLREAYLLKGSTASQPQYGAQSYGRHQYAPPQPPPPPPPNQRLAKSLANFVHKRDQLTAGAESPKSIKLKIIT